MLRAAVARGHAMVYLCDSDDVAGTVDRLTAYDPDVPVAVRTGQLDVRAARQQYLPDGRFDPVRMLGALAEALAVALARGFAGLSITGEMGWMRDGPPGHERLEEYERMVSAAFKAEPIVLLCQYDTRLPGFHAGVEALHDVDFAPELAPIGRDGGATAAHVTGDGALRLAGELDYEGAPAVADVLSAHFHGPLRLDLADIGFIDVAGMRALRGRIRQPVAIATASASVRRLVQLLAWDTDPDVQLAA
jgi:ABC-type transporter Mla MlaB component